MTKYHVYLPIPMFSWGSKVADMTIDRQQWRKEHQQQQQLRRLFGAERQCRRFWRSYAPRVSVLATQNWFLCSSLVPSFIAPFSLLNPFGRYPHHHSPLFPSLFFFPIIFYYHHFFFLLIISLINLIIIISHWIFASWIMRGIAL